MIIYADLKTGTRFVAKAKFRLTVMEDSDSILTVVKVGEEAGVNTMVTYSTHHGKLNTCKLSWLKDYWEKV